jgi:hypothetical protein
MQQASNAIDHLTQEVTSLKRIIVAERAQLIYYTERALAFMRREDVSVELTNFSDLPEERKQGYVEQAIRKLGSDQAVIPHSTPGQPSNIVSMEDQPTDPGKKRPGLIV